MAERDTDRGPARRPGKRTTRPPAQRPTRPADPSRPTSGRPAGSRPSDADPAGSNEWTAGAVPRAPKWVPDNPYVPGKDTPGRDVPDKDVPDKDGPDRPAPSDGLPFDLGAWDSEIPMLLVPVQVETKYVSNDDGDELRIRIIPDRISVRARQRHRRPRSKRRRRSGRPTTTPPGRTSGRPSGAGSSADSARTVPGSSRG